MNTKALEEPQTPYLNAMTKFFPDHLPNHSDLDYAFIELGNLKEYCARLRAELDEARKVAWNLYAIPCANSSDIAADYFATHPEVEK